MKAVAAVLACLVVAGTAGLIGMNNSIQEVETSGSMDETHVIHEDYMVDGIEMHVEYMNLSNVNIDEVI
jgi:hypothetical protein